MTKSPPDEGARLEALRSYAILDTSFEREFDNLAELAADICETPIAVITLVDEARQWFKAAYGLSIRETARAVAFCNLAIQQSTPLVVHNALEDPRFSSNPLVLGSPNIRFYACQPLVTDTGHAIGTLAVIDQIPRTLTERQHKALETLAGEVMLRLEHRKQRLDMQRLLHEKQASDIALQEQRELLEIAGRVGKIGGWKADLATRTMQWTLDAASVHDLDVTVMSFDEAVAFYPPQWRVRLLEAFRQCAKLGVGFDEEMELVTATGRRKWVRVIGQPFVVEGDIRAVHGAVQDIHERKTAELNFLNSQEEFRRLSDSMPHIVWTAQPDGTVDYANRAMADYVGLEGPIDGAIDWPKALHPDDVDSTVRQWRRCVATGVPLKLEYRLQRASDLTYRWMSVQAQPIRDGDGRIARWYGTVTDVHDTKAQQVELAQTAGLLNATLESIADGFFVLDTQWRFKYFNPEAERLLGKRRHDVIGQIAFDVVPLLRESAVQASLRLSMLERVLQQVEFRAVDEARWFEFRVYPAEQGISAYFRDVTAQHEAVQMLRISEERFQKISKATADAMWDWDLLTDTVWWNEGMQTLFGYCPEELEPDARSWSSRVHPDDHDRVTRDIEAVIQAAAAEYWSSEYRFRRKDGSYAEIMDRGFVIRDDQGRAIRMVGGMTDQTERKAAERAAQREVELRHQILRVQQEISSAPVDLDTACALMAEKAMEIVKADGVEIELVDGADLVCRAAHGPVNRGRGARVSISGSLAGLAVVSGEPQYCRDARSDHRVVRAICEDVGILSVLVVPLRNSGVTVGVLRAVARQPDAFSASEVTSLQQLSESLGAVIERARITEELRDSEAQYRQLFDNSPQPMWVYEARSLRFLAVNRAAVSHYGYSAFEFSRMTVRDVLAPGTEAMTLQELGQIQAAQRTSNLSRRHVCRNGDLIDVEISAGPIDFDGKVARLVLINDVTKRLAAERELARVSRAQRMLSACNESLIRAEEEHALLMEICKLAVEIGGYRLAWVGFAVDNDTRPIVPAASFGEGGEFLKALPLSWDATNPGSRGVAGRAIIQGEIQVSEDVRYDKAQLTWRKETLAAGFVGAIGLPLRDKSGTLGVLCLYSDEPIRFSQEERTLLNELANDLTFGVVNLRRLAAQSRLQAAVQEVASAVSHSTDSHFFETLALSLTQATGASAGFIVKLSQGPTPGEAHTLAAVVDGRQVEDTTYLLHGTPCADLVAQRTLVVVSGLGGRYPQTGYLALQGAEAYAGRRLDDARGRPIGLMFVAYTRRLAAIDLVESTLSVFATRAAAELERLEADGKIRSQAELLNKARDAIIVRSLDHRIEFWNQGSERLYGWRQEEVLGHSIAQLLYDDPTEYYARTRETLAAGEWNGEISQRRRNGEVMHIEGRWTLVRNEQGEPQSILAINTDITARKAAEAEIHRLAYYDALTGLPNRVQFQKRLQSALNDPEAEGSFLAVLILNIDNFKTLNETRGHHLGDELLQMAAERLQPAVEPQGMLARLSADEFAVLVTGLDRDGDIAAEQAKALSQTLSSSFVKPFTFSDQSQLITSVCIGIAVADDLTPSVADLLKQVDLALTTAKSVGRNTIKLFEKHLQTELHERAELESDLRLALQKQELELHYQPQFSATGELYGAEALVRWRLPRLGLVSPGRFVPLAEDTGLILPIGAWVIAEACRSLRAWAHEPDLAGLVLSVNVSAKQFLHANFVDQVRAALAEQGVDARRLKIELTESLLIYDIEVVLERMNALKWLGVGLSLDDFGTGYSSLSYLRQLPLDQLKIDQSFTRGILDNPKDLSIVKTIIDLGHSLSLQVVAEGVELSDQRDRLVELGCDAFQGYLYSRPVPRTDLERLIRSGLQPTGLLPEASAD